MAIYKENEYKEAIKRIKQKIAELEIEMGATLSEEEISQFEKQCNIRLPEAQIVEYHHNQKRDAPSGTALMIKDALFDANKKINKEKVNIYSIRGGNIFGEHEVIFANCKDEIVTFKHQVSSRETFADGAIEVSVWTAKQTNGLYDMNSFCNRFIE